MKESFKGLKDKIGSSWSKWTKIQKAVLLGVLVVGVVLFVSLFSWSSSSPLVPVLDVKITDQEQLDKIVLRLNEEDIKTNVTDGIVYVSDSSTARRMRSLLIREDLIPKDTSPWDIFNVERWTRTDFERKVDLRRAIIEEVRRHIKALDDVDDASVVVNVPENAMFASEQNPVTASVIIYPKPGSDIATNRKKVEGIQKLLKLAVEGLKDEDITISDNQSNILNDFAGMKDWDRLSIIEKQQKMIAKMESRYEIKVLNALQKIYGADRVREVSIKIEMDMSEKSSQTTKILPTEMKHDNPDTPYDDSEIVHSITTSSEVATTTWEGEGTNPEGPEGVQGQTPPSYKDMSNIAGRSTQSIVKKNEVYSSSQISEIVSPQMGRRTVAVNIDGQWKKKRNDKGEYIIKDGGIEREFIELSTEERKQAEEIVQGAIGYNPNRDDIVKVAAIRIDRSGQFEEEDMAYFQGIQRQKIILISLAGIAGLLILFIIYRVVSRERERRRRLKEEEALRQAQLERERILWEAEKANNEVAMTVDERKRLELQENAINVAREHPEDVALLIRTWLMEE
ncbi:MAG: flagellar basal-body MS-ring/collar protein FliF [Treponema sp.]